MIPSNAVKNKQDPSPRVIALADTGQTHAVFAASLCAFAVILVLLIAQWMPALGANPISNAGEVDLNLLVDTATPFMLRF